MNSLGISSAATSARLCAMSTSRDPGSLSLNAFPVEASCLRIEKGFMLEVYCGNLDIHITHFAAKKLLKYPKDLGSTSSIFRWNVPSHLVRPSIHSRLFAALLPEALNLSGSILCVKGEYLVFTSGDWSRARGTSTEVNRG